MSQALLIYGKQFKIVLYLLLFMLFAGIFAAFWLTNSDPPEEDVNPTISLEIIQNKLSAAAEFKDYLLMIDERGPGYMLRFNGQMRDGHLYGKLESHELEIYSDQEQVFVRGSETSEEWMEVEKAELDGLTFLVKNPFSLLSELLSDKQVKVLGGPMRMVEDIACQTYFLEIPPPELRLLTNFEEDAIFERLQLYLWFAEDNLFMHRMALLFSFTVKEEKIQIYRIYNLRPGVKEMPQDLPNLAAESRQTISHSW